MSEGCHGSVTPEETPSTPSFVGEEEGGEVIGNPAPIGVPGDEDSDFDVPEEDIPTVSAGQGIREFQADFDTVTRVLSSGASLARRPDAVSFDYLTAFSVGPVALGDSSAGARDRVWRIRAVNNLALGTGVINICRANDTNTAWEAESELFSYVGDAVEVDLAFEQQARAVVALEIDGHLWLYWFDPTIGLGEFTLTDFGVGRTPRCLLDNVFDTTDSDVLVFYIVDGTGVRYRQQRDRYQNELLTPINTYENHFLEDVFKVTDNRLVVSYSVRNATTGRYSLGRLESTLYPYKSDIDEFQIPLLFSAGTLEVVVINNTPPVEELQAPLDFESGTLADVILLHTLFDIDEFQGPLDFESGTLVVVVLTHTAFDIDEFQAPLDFASGTLVVVVIQHELFDIDEFQAPLTFVGGTLV